MRRNLTALVGTAAVVASLFVTGAAAQVQGAVPEDAAPTVDNPYFPLEPASSRRYEGTETDPSTGETTELLVHEHISPVT